MEQCMKKVKIIYPVDNTSTVQCFIAELTNRLSYCYEPTLAPPHKDRQPSILMIPKILCYRAG